MRFKITIMELLDEMFPHLLELSHELKMEVKRLTGSTLYVGFTPRPLMKRQRQALPNCCWGYALGFTGYLNELESEYYCWAVITLYRESNNVEVANEIISQWAWALGSKQLAREMFYKF